MQTHLSISKVFVSFKFSVAVALVMSLIFAAPSLAAPKDNIHRILSARQINYAEADLEKIAGSKDNLIKILLEMRLEQTAPFVAERAEKLLLTYADIELVETALADDMRSTNTAHLARVITVYIDRVPSTETRSLLATLAVERAERDPKFRAYVHNLIDSQDEQVSSNARKSLR